jgi:protein-L-isoaspartate(D-aspartate) O-methyltransferase
MAGLSPRQRQDWLASLASRPGGIDPSDTPRVQELREVARGCRLSLVESLRGRLGPFDEHHLRAVLEVPRERFVRPEDVEHSAADTPLALDATGLATISAPHAYLMSFRLLSLAPGDALVELGTGSGYGAALAAFIVGPEGSVVSFEIDPALASQARRALHEGPDGTRNVTPNVTRNVPRNVTGNVTVFDGDAVTNSELWCGASRVVVTFAIDAWPSLWLDTLPEGGRLVAPLGRGDQRLVLAEKRGGKIVETDHGAVRYVRNRSAR